MSWQVHVQVQLGTFALDVALAGTSNAPVALIGPNGSGKTTVLRTVAGAYRPHAGRIQVGDHVLFNGESNVDLRPEMRRVGYVPQGYGLFPHLSVLDNVAFGKAASSTGDRRRAAGALLERFECASLADRMPATLSGGEQQRVALARSLMIDPAILLLDEPLSALDPRARRSLRAYLAEHLAQRGRPALVATHDQRDVQALGAMVYAIEDGRIVQSGSASELSRAPATEFVAEFFGIEPAPTD